MKGLEKLRAAKQWPLWRRKKLLAAIFVLMFLSVVTIKAIQAMNSPSKGKIIDVPPPAETAEEMAKKSINTLDTRYFTMLYPGRYRLTENQPKSPGLIDYWTLTALSDADSPSAQVGITIKNMTGASIEDESAYQSYSLNKDKYIKESVSYGNIQAIVFTRQNQPGSQQIAFIAKSHTVVTIALTSSFSTGQTLKNEFSYMLESFAWK